ncbi:MAG: bifunctional phosphopantothenoylcysteine decarboxylase/phosphopantothenate--cysteine ligase CoaBC [Candidatus Zixiibacteriota bacterium]|nr:MAG: bifunctional phosphopantothenoylcysteine decarboxylase/phosphopantothenate--cysteine ligase CoaBC [candidate division Zixibacteria bacterium]
MSLQGKRILVGLTGGIACYKIPYLVRYLWKDKAEIRVVMTEAATKFITPLTLESVSNNPVASDLFPADRFVGTRHIDMAQWPDLVVVAPATANFMGKVVSGISDDLLTTIICATPKPVMIAPAMNPQMWLNKVTQRNFATLKELGYIFVGPGEGGTACDHYGIGRMAEPEELYEAIKKFLAKGSRQSRKKKALTGKKILITAGPTREAIDPVRFISNRSSGKMGFALAEAAVASGAETTLISGPTDLTPPAGVRYITIETTGQLRTAVKKEFVKSDCLIMAAAPADYQPKKKQLSKIKKSDKELTLPLKPTVDILKDIASVRRKKQVVVGFALETDDAIANARRKLKEKKLDMIVVNTPGADTGFEHDTNSVTLIMPGKKPVELPLASKSQISFSILDRLSTLL